MQRSAPRNSCQAAHLLGNFKAVHTPDPRLQHIAETPSSLLQVAADTNEWRNALHMAQRHQMESGYAKDQRVHFHTPVHVTQSDGTCELIRALERQMNPTTCTSCLFSSQTEPCHTGDFQSQVQSNSYPHTGPAITCCSHKL